MANSIKGMLEHENTLMRDKLAKEKKEADNSDMVMEKMEPEINTLVVDKLAKEKKESDDNTLTMDQMGAVGKHRLSAFEKVLYWTAFLIGILVHEYGERRFDDQDRESIFKKNPRFILAILGTFGLVSNVIFISTYGKTLGWKRMLINGTILAVEYVIVLATMPMVALVVQGQEQSCLFEVKVA